MTIALFPLHFLQHLTLKHQMKMVGHQAIGLDFKTRLLAGFGQGLNEILPVHAVQKHRLTSVAAAHDLVNGPRLLDSHFAWHSATFPDSYWNVNQQLTKVWIDPLDNIDSCLTSQNRQIIRKRTKLWSDPYFCISDLV